MHLSYQVLRLGNLSHALFLLSIYGRGERERYLDRSIIDGIICIYLEYMTDRNKERKAVGKRFNQMAAKWLNRSEFGWGTLYWASRVITTSRSIMLTLVR